MPSKKTEFSNDEAKALENLGKIISNFRAEKNITQTDLAKQTGINRTYLNMIEKGGVNPSYLKLLKICEVLGLDVRFEKR